MFALLGSWSWPQKRSLIIFEWKDRERWIKMFAVLGSRSGKNWKFLSLLGLVGTWHGMLVADHKNGLSIITQFNKKLPNNKRKSLLPGQKRRENKQNSDDYSQNSWLWKVQQPISYVYCYRGPNKTQLLSKFLTRYFKRLLEYFALCWHIDNPHSIFLFNRRHEQYIQAYLPLCVVLILSKKHHGHNDIMNHTIHSYPNSYRAVCVEFAKVDGVHKGDVVGGVPVEAEGGRVRLFKREEWVMPLRTQIIHTWLPSSSPLEKTCSSACQRAPCQSICWSAPPPSRYLSGFLNFLLRVHFKDTAFETPKNFICQVFKVCLFSFLSYILSILSSWAVDDGEASADEVVLDVHDDERWLWSHDLGRGSLFLY